MHATPNNTGSSAMTLPSMPFPLMRLPGEMRNQIYREYFNSVTENNSIGINDINKSPHKLQPCLNILHASREVRSEAVSIFYKEYIGTPSGEPKSLSVPVKNPYHWEITGSSQTAQVQRLADFCTSLAEHKTTDINVAVRIEGASPREAVSPRFADVLTKYMVCSLGGVGKKSSRVRVDSIWQRVKAEIIGTNQDMAVLIMTRTFQKGEFEMVYHYDRLSNWEFITLVGPLAKIDWRGFLAVGFPAPMEALELRGEVALRFAKGSEVEYGVQTAQDSWQMNLPGLMGWWTSVAGPPRRVRIWCTEVSMFMSACERSDGKLEMEETLVLPGKPRRNSTPGHGSRGLRASRSRQGSFPRQY
jgi:hypothetical protein